MRYSLLRTRRLQMHQHAREWKPHAPSSLLDLSICWSAPKQLCITNSLCWESLTYCLHRSGRSLVVSLKEIGKIWFQTNHQWLTKPTAVSSPVPVTKDCIGRPWCLILSKERTNWIPSHRSSVGYVTPRFSYCLVNYFVWTRAQGRVPWGNSLLELSTNQGFLWITDVVELKPGAIIESVLGQVCGAHAHRQIQSVHVISRDRPYRQH